MKDDLRYTPTDCFETFPFPPNWQTEPGLESAGQAYYEHRAVLMLATNKGLTRTYNDFHDEACASDPDIAKLHALHAAMDRAMLAAYGWLGDFSDAKLACDYLAIHADDEDDDSGKPVKKRYRWSDETRDKVLAKLLAENERQAGTTSASGSATAAPAFTLKAPAAPCSKTPKKPGRKPRAPKT